MATELVTRVWCDACLSEEVRTDGAQGLLVGPNIAGLRTLDLCERHYADLAGGVLALAASMGVKLDLTEPAESPAPTGLPEGHKLSPGRRTTAVVDQVCLVCWTSLTTGQIRGHLGRIHGVNAMGLTPFIATGDCPLCDRVSPSVRALSQHTSVRHDMSMSAAFALARSQGDPRGVVAKLRSVEEVRAAPPGSLSAMNPTVAARQREQREQARDQDSA